MNYKLVPVEPTPEMLGMGGNLRYTTEAEVELIYKAMLEAVPDVPMELEPVARVDYRLLGNLSVEWLVDPRPEPGTNLYAMTPDVAAVIAAKDALLKQWEEKAANWLASPESVARLEGYMDLRKHLAAAERMLSLFVNVADSWLLATANDRAKYAEARQRTLLAFKQTYEEMKGEKA